MCVFVTGYVSVSVLVNVTVDVSVCMSVCITVLVCVAVCVCVSLCVCVCYSVCVTVCVCVCTSVSVCLCVTLCMLQCVSLCACVLLYVCAHVAVCVSLYVTMFVWVTVRHNVCVCGGSPISAHSPRPAAAAQQGHPAPAWILGDVLTGNRPSSSPYRSAQLINTLLPRCWKRAVHQLNPTAISGRVCSSFVKIGVQKSRTRHSLPKLDPYPCWAVCVSSPVLGQRPDQTRTGPYPCWAVCVMLCCLCHVGQFCRNIKL